MQKAIFTISLDTELGWGFILHPKHKVLALLKNDSSQGRKTIDLLIRLFEKYNIPATWAVVGHLFLDPKEAEEMIHRGALAFREKWIDWENYCNLRSNPLYFGEDIVKKILDSSLKHEIGLHGFFHIPFSQCSEKVAEAEIKLGKKAANKFNIAPKSFIFPQNMIRYQNLLKRNGFQIYRGKTAGDLSSSKIFLVRKLKPVMVRIISSPVSLLEKNGIWEIPGSMEFYNFYLSSILPWRAHLGLNWTIARNKNFHIWLHPWSLLVYKRLAEDLERFLYQIAQKREEGEVEIKTMGQLIPKEVYVNSTK